MKLRRLWTVVPIVAAFVMMLVFASVAAPTRVEAARALWDARRLTRYEMQVVYYNNNGAPCNQTLIVEGEQVVEVRLSLGCDTPIGNIEYPTATDILDYLQAKTDEYASSTVCGANDCSCYGRMGVNARYDPRVGYPMRADIRPMIGQQGTTGSVCPIDALVEYSSIEIRRLIPQ
jgi:hypothetical protein